MRFSSLIFFVLGLAVGALCVWLTASDEAAKGELTAEHLGESGAVTLASKASLDGEVENEQKEGPPVVVLSERGRELLTEFENESGTWDEASLSRGWKALASLYAIAGRYDDMHRMFDVGAELSCAIDDVLDVLKLLPTSEQVASLRAFLVRDSSYWSSGWKIASFFLSRGDSSGAAKAARESLPAHERQHAYLLDIYLKAEPDAAVAASLDLAERTEHWGDVQFLEVAKSMIEVDRKTAASLLLRIGVAEVDDDEELVGLWATIDFAAASAYLETKIRGAPDDAALWKLLASIRREAGDLAGAMDADEMAIRQDPGDDWLEDLLNEDPKRALSVMREVLANSRDDESIGVYAKALARNGQLEEAADAYLRALSFDPEDSEWLSALVRLDPARTATYLQAHIGEWEPSSFGDEVLGIYARALAATGKTSDAMGFYELAHSKDQSDGEWISAMLGIDESKALRTLSSSLKEDDAESVGLVVLGLSHAAKGDKQQAQALFARAQKEGHADEWTWRLLARHDPVKAVDNLRAVTLDGGDASQYAALAYILRDQGDVAAARDAFDKALNDSPNNTRWRLDRELLK